MGTQTLYTQEMTL